MQSSNDSDRGGEIDQSAPYIRSTIVKSMSLDRLESSNDPVCLFLSKIAAGKCRLVGKQSKGGRPPSGEGGTFALASPRLV
jgi:hypothetical protein